jgi:hypothetical protein
MWNEAAARPPRFFAAPSFLVALPGTRLKWRRARRSGVERPKVRRTQSAGIARKRNCAHTALVADLQNERRINGGVSGGWDRAG